MKTVALPQGVFIFEDAMHQIRHFVYRNGRWYGYTSAFKASQPWAPSYANGPSLSAIQRGMVLLQAAKRSRKVRKGYSK